MRWSQVWRGKPYQCLLLARAKVVEHVYCAEVMAELSEKLRETFGFSENHIQYDVYGLCWANTIPSECIAGAVSAVFGIR
jgi:hypothetical protein